MLREASVHGFIALLIEKLFIDAAIGWQRVSGHGWRALVEADIARWKRVISDGLRSQTDRRQASEVAIAAGVLNRMLELEGPKYVRIA
jgi:hypothetical protein